jgi:hypothetical protein
MKLSSLFALLALSGSLCAQEKTSPSAAAAESPTKPKASQEELEAKFKATMTKATMAGRWCSVKEGKMGPEREDKYSIVGVSKIGGDAWIIQARIQYNQRDIIAPIPVQVKWAGDTPVITLDNVPVPGGGVYSARVLVYGDTYAGTWSGGDHGGLLNGIITQEAEGKAETKPETK